MSNLDRHIAITASSLRSMKKRILTNFAIHHDLLSESPESLELSENTCNNVLRDARSFLNIQVHMIFNFCLNFLFHENCIKEKIIQNQIDSFIMKILLISEIFFNIENYKLSVLLKQDQKSFFTELISILEHYNKISAIFNSILCIFEKTHSIQNISLRKILEHDIIRIIWNSQSQSKIVQNKIYIIMIIQIQEISFKNLLMIISASE